MDYELIKPDENDAYDPAPFLNYARARRTDKEERDPDIGDTVHWWNGEKCMAAIVIEVGAWADSKETLTVLASGREPMQTYGLHDEARDEHTWHWPCGGH